jgi:hypothetical protein
MQYPYDRELHEMIESIRIHTLWHNSREWSSPGPVYLGDYMVDENAEASPSVSSWQVLVNVQAFSKGGEPTLAFHLRRKYSESFEVPQRILAFLPTMTV